MTALPTEFAIAANFRFSDDPFRLGVASGYPETDGVVIWTRLAPRPLEPGGGMPSEVIPVEWEVAADDGFRTIVRNGRSYASPESAHAVHVEVGGLAPGRDYWYRFTSGGARSSLGRTRTAPQQDSLTALRVAVGSCQQYEGGYYAAYAAIARDHLDLILHVGDYIYENRGTERARAHDQPECFTLQDYRLRHALYRLDPMLQQAHASAPWMLTWDDHEVDNDYASAQSEDNDETEFFLARRAAAYQAYYEHQPLPRRMIPLGPHQRLHTFRSFGALADIYMLDGRQYRDTQACGQRLVSPCAALYAQERWLDSSFNRSRSRWTLLAQQTVFAHADQQPGPDVGYWSDGWSGYPAARQRLLDGIISHKVSNPVVLSGDIHAYLVNDVHAHPGKLDSAVVATELVTTSVSSPGPAEERLARWAGENPNIRLARGDVRGHTRLTITRDELHADLIAVDDAARPDSGTSVLASFTVLDGTPGVAA